MATLRITWFAALVVFVGAFIAFSVIGSLFGDRTQDAWQWLLPNLLPPVGAVFGINLAQQAAGKSGDAEGGEDASQVEPGGFGSVRYAIAFSWLFIAAMGVSVLGVLFTTDPIEFLTMSNYWLAPLLGLAMAMLGACLAMGKSR